MSQAGGMRFGLYLPKFLARPAGLGVYIDGLCQEILAQGDDCIVFTEEAGALPRWASSSPVVRPPRAALCLPSWLARPFLIQLWLRRQIKRHQLDVLFLPFHDGVYRAAVPQLIVVHDLNILSYPDVFPARLRWYMRWVFRPVLQTTDRVIAVSHSTRDDLIARWNLEPSRVAVVTEGCDRRIFRPYDAQATARARSELGISGRYFLYSGTLSPHKNLVTALGAFADMASATPDVSFLITTDLASPQRPGLERTIETLGLAGRVRLVDYLERDRLGSLMAGALAFVFPSLHEGFGLAALEAMACGTPVIAADRTSLPEVVGDGGILVAAEDRAAWKRAFLDVATDSELAASLGRRALAQADHFHWNHAAAEILALAAASTHR